MSTASKEQSATEPVDALSGDLLVPALDAIDKPIALVRADGEVRHVNSAWSLMLSAYGAGLSAWGPGANLIPAWRSAFPDETAEAVVEKFHAVAAGESAEERIVAPFGTEAEAPSSRLRMTSLGKDASRTILVTYDLWIPARDSPGSTHDESEAAAESERLFRFLADAAPFLVWTTDADHELSFVNRAWSKFTGRSREEDLGGGWHASVPEEDSDRLVGQFREALETHEPVQFEYPHRRHDGAYRWFLEAGRPRFRNDGAFVGYIGTSVDITERKETEQQLRESEGRLQLIADSLPVLVSKVGADLRYEFANRRYLDWYGLEPELMRGLPMKDFFGDVVWPEIEGYVHRALAGETVSFEWTAPKRGGGVRHQVSDYIPSRDNDGNVDGFVVLVTDVSESRANADRIRELNEELEQRVQARTARLIAVNEELEEFCASVSHDLRQPLRGMEGFSQILIDGYAERLDEEGVDYLARIRQASRRMGRLIDELLELSRLTRGDLQREPVDLSKIADEILADLREREPRRTVTTRVQPDIEAIGDAALLEDMLRSLLSNAWKFTRHEEKAKVEFDVEQGPTGPIYVVRDNGVGFDMRYAGKLFAAFQRLHGPEEFEGDGIGLATAARIVGRHGGRIWANAVEDEGATFSFTLTPTSPSDDDQAGAESKADRSA